MATILRPRPLTPGSPTQATGPRPPTPGLARLRGAPWLAAAGFAAMAEAMAGSLAAANWQPGLAGLPWLVGLAVLLGFLLARGRRFSWPLWPLGLAIGVIVSVRLPASAFLPGKLSWDAQISSVLGRLVDWVEKGLSGRVTQEDVLIALAVASFAYVWTYVWYAPTVEHQQGWLGSAMMAAPLFGNVLFKPAAGGAWLILWAAGALAVVLSSSLERRAVFYERLAFSGWKDGRRIAFAGGSMIAAIVTAAFAVAPQVKVNDKLNELYQRLNAPIGQAQRAYDQMGVPKQYDASQIRVDSFQSQLKFLGPFRPGTELVMKIRTDRARYEQGVVFDHYEAGGWTNSRFNQFQTNGNDFATLTGIQETSRDRDRKQIAEDIIAVRPAGALLFAAPQPLGASVRLKGDGFGDLRATAVIQPNQLYTAAALESQATAEALAATNGPIPPSVLSAFLQLPAGFPSRIKQLADQQTAGKTNTYDKALALESFLRTFKFDSETPPPPPGRDGVDWFLFDLKRGYSDYNASAMAVMLRSLNIPARVVAGYSPGQLDPNDGLVHITQKEAHTWTQAYFPGYGWIDFEPTPNDPAFPRSHSPRDQSQGSAQQQSTPSPVPSAPLQPLPGAGSTSSAGAGGHGSAQASHFPWWLLAVLAALLGMAAYVYTRLRGAPGARLAYMRLALAGSLLGMRQHKWQTPKEYGHALQARRRFDPSSTDTITHLYTADSFAPQRLDDRANRRAWTAWQYLRGRLLRLRLRDQGSGIRDQR